MHFDILRFLPGVWRTFLVGSIVSLACDSAGAAPDVWGIELPVSDVDAASRFYSSALGCEVETAYSAESGAVLRNGAVHLVLRKSDVAADVDGAARVYLNYRVADLDAAARAVTAAGGFVVAAEPKKFAIGRSLAITDPWGNPANLVAIDGGEPFRGAPVVFNVSVTVKSFPESEPFFAKLGFRVFSRDYLPESLPLERDGAVAIVLHARATASATPGKRHGTLLLRTSDAKQAVAATRNAGIAVASDATRPGPAGPEVAFAGPLGVSIAFVEHSKAWLAFERLRALQGTWDGKSTKGWEEKITYETIAGGSVVVETSKGAHPGETMLSALHMDGERLMLTHYCVAQNQPRLVATAFDDDGKTITFTYLDGTNLPSHDRGHMDKVIFRFADADHFSAQWTWYQDGKESWMEEIQHARVP
ncbi:MAG: hypothetical protein HYR85_03695 [Planctomycetes bacterium]|nr:hypothetical protein [Planctomycetota bacterium]MBI3847173.1 hypothetical protein [Planctomycetota bacterium]